MARCPDCNKFVPYGDMEIELEDVSVEGTTVTASARVALTCGECGTELKEATIEATAELEHVCTPEDIEAVLAGDPDGADPDPQYEVEDDGDASPTERSEGKGRGTRTFYGYEATPTIRCNKCGQTFDVEVKGDEQASGFEDNC